MVLMDEDEVLQAVDEYSLYCFYLEYTPEIRCNYTSPIRPEEDQAPSFGIYPVSRKDREYMWKDSGGLGKSGDIFTLVQLLFGYETRWEALMRICSDFNLGAHVPKTPKVVTHNPVVRTNADIRIKSRNFSQAELDWWMEFGISCSTLSLYRVSALYWYYMNSEQKKPIFPPRFSFVYRIYDRYQLYFPKNEKHRKFRNDLKPEHVMGLQQLPEKKSDVLIITKSYKDVMCLHELGYEAVASRSENTPMPREFFGWADTHYKRKYVLFDNDMKHRGDWYPYPKIYVPLDSGAKDISDFRKAYGHRDTAALMQNLLS